MLTIDWWVLLVRNNKKKHTLYDPFADEFAFAQHFAITKPFYPSVCTQWTNMFIWECIHRKCMASSVSHYANLSSFPPIIQEPRPKRAALVSNHFYPNDHVLTVSHHPPCHRIERRRRRRQRFMSTCMRMHTSYIRVCEHQPPSSSNHAWHLCTLHVRLLHNMHKCSRAFMYKRSGVLCAA